MAERGISPEGWALIDGSGVAIEALQKAEVSLGRLLSAAAGLASEGFVCAFCGVYDREERFDGHNDYTVCVRCGRSELRFGQRKT